LSFYLGYMLPPAAVLFVIPCLLPWRWICGYVPLAAIGAAIFWWQHWTHRYEGNGAAVVLGEIMLMYATAGAIFGVVALLAILGLRAWRVRWRYAWLPAPALFALLIAAPFLMKLYAEFDNRPPPEACLASSHRLELAGMTLSVPPAPIFIVVPADEKMPYYLAFPDKARAFCRMVARADPLPVRRLSLDLERQGPLYRHQWHAALCIAIRNRSWLHRLCEGPALEAAEHYPQWLSLGPSADLARGSYAEIWSLQQQPSQAMPAQTNAQRVLHRLSAGDGTTFVAACWLFNKGRAECDAVFEPRPGLAAQFRVSVARDRMAAVLTAVQAQTAAIVQDLLRP
jgi:hypothetical protein